MEKIIAPVQKERITDNRRKDSNGRLQDGGGSHRVMRSSISQPPPGLRPIQPVQRVEKQQRLMFESMNERLTRLEQSLAEI